jgi:hypothetical protein
MAPRGAFVLCPIFGKLGYNSVIMVAGSIRHIRHSVISSDILLQAASDVCQTVKQLWKLAMSPIVMIAANI